MATLVKISVNEDIARVLERLKRDYPTLDNAELFKLGLAELDRRAEVDRRQRWAEGLPVLTLSAGEAASIVEARAEIETASSEPMTAEELLASLTRD